MQVRKACFVMLALLLLPFPAGAISPKEQLVGIWRFKRGTGNPCASEILSLKYSFHKDGRYSAKAQMRTGGGSRAWEYSGTYVATDTETTAYVDGQTVGPYPYKILNDMLIISQPEWNCEVTLEREDY